jgi:glucosyl-dolichyl phosphate glucuronosyltransferase
MADAHMAETSSGLDISVVIPTYNRGSQLLPLLDALLRQDARGVRYEIIVVDNNSRDNTAAVVEAAGVADQAGLIRYFFEPRQGVSHARNTGILHARAPIIAFVDDDVSPSSDWVYSMKRAFDEYPQADCIGGRVRAVWTHKAKPSWLTDAHAGPVAVQDRPQQQWVSRANASTCLLGANFAFRRSVFDEIGLFSPEYPRNQDRELELRMWRAGKHGLYLPAMNVFVEIPEDRLTKRYHRRWQATTGKYHARLRFRDTVDQHGRLHDQECAGRRLLGTPLFLYRECLTHALEWFRALFALDGDRRFYHESRLWYFASFFWTRFKTDVLPRVVRQSARPPSKDVKTAV